MISFRYKKELELFLTNEPNEDYSRIIFKTKQINACKLILSNHIVPTALKKSIHKFNPYLIPNGMKNKQIHNPL